MFEDCHGINIFTKFPTLFDRTFMTILFDGEVESREVHCYSNADHVKASHRMERMEWVECRIIF